MPEQVQCEPKAVCPQCGSEKKMVNWSELTDEEREVVRRLPASADAGLDERKAENRWCRRCWYESFGGMETLT